MVPYHRQWQEHPNQLARTAQVLDLWSQADHWPADAFRDHFLSHMYKLSLSEAPRDGMRQLAQAKTQPEIDSAGYQLGRSPPERFLIRQNQVGKRDNSPRHRNR